MCYFCYWLIIDIYILPPNIVIKNKLNLSPIFNPFGSTYVRKVFPVALFLLSPFFSFFFFNNKKPNKNLLISKFAY